MAAVIAPTSVQASTPAQIAPVASTTAPIRKYDGFRDGDQIIESFAPRSTRPIIAAPPVAEAGLMTTMSLTPTTLLTSTMPLTVTAEPPHMTPEEIAAAEAAMRDGQARMSNARAQFRISAIAAAERDVSDAAANLEKVRAVHVSEEDVAAAESERRAAQADLDRVRQESSNEALIGQAQADLQAAEARLQAAQSQTAPDPALVAAVQQRLDAAKQQLTAIANEAYARKMAAQEALNQAVAALAQAQQLHDTSTANHEKAQQGIDPVSGKTFAEVNLDPATEQLRYALAFSGTQANLADMYMKADAATAAFQEAQRREAADVAAAQAVVDQAQAELAQLPQVADAATIAQAQLDVDNAHARLAQLQQESGAVVAATQRVTDAQTRLDTLRAEWAAAERLITEAQQRLDAAKASLALARRSAASAGGWIWPTFGTLTSGFGKRNLAVNTYHTGIDIANAANTPIGAARFGTVIEAGWCAGYGFCVKIDHGDGLSSEYGHMGTMPLVRAGNVVEAGTIIGLMGTTYDADHGGYSTGVHLHLTIRRYGEAVDPLQYLP